MDHECWVLYVFVHQSRERNCEWHEHGAVSGEMDRKGE